MKPIIVVMLAVEAAMLVITCVTMLTARTEQRRRPLWPGLAIALVIVAATGQRIGAGHDGQAGAGFLEAGATFLLGMGIMAMLMALRHRRALD